MHNDRIIDLGEDLRNHVFEMLDAEPEMTGEDAGKIAAAVEKAFVETTQTLVVFQIDDPQFCDLEPGTIFRFASEPDQDYEKVGDKHYRKGRYQINNICLPISNRREGITT